MSQQNIKGTFAIEYVKDHGIGISFNSKTDPLFKYDTVKIIGINNHGIVGIVENIFPFAENPEKSIAHVIILKSILNGKPCNWIGNLPQADSSIRKLTSREIINYTTADKPLNSVTLGKIAGTTLNFNVEGSLLETMNLILGSNIPERNYLIKILIHELNNKNAKIIIFDHQDSFINLPKFKHLRFTKNIKLSINQYGYENFVKCMTQDVDDLLKPKLRSILAMALNKAFDKQTNFCSFGQLKQTLLSNEFPANIVAPMLPKLAEIDSTGIFANTIEETVNFHNLFANHNTLLIDLTDLESSWIPQVFKSINKYLLESSLQIPYFVFINSFNAFIYQRDLERILNRACSTGYNAFLAESYEGSLINQALCSTNNLFLMKGSGTIDKNHLSFSELIYGLDHHECLFYGTASSYYPIKFSTRGYSHSIESKNYYFGKVYKIENENGILFSYDEKALDLPEQALQPDYTHSYPSSSSSSYPDQIGQSFAKIQENSSSLEIYHVEYPEEVELYDGNYVPDNTDRSYPHPPAQYKEQEEDEEDTGYYHPDSHYTETHAQNNDLYTYQEESYPEISSQDSYNNVHQEFSSAVENTTYYHEKDAEHHDYDENEDYYNEDEEEYYDDENENYDDEDTNLIEGYDEDLEDEGYYEENYDDEEEVYSEDDIIETYSEDIDEDEFMPLQTNHQPKIEPEYTFDTPTNPVRQKKKIPLEEDENELELPPLEQVKPPAIPLLSAEPQRNKSQEPLPQKKIDIPVYTTPSIDIEGSGFSKGMRVEHERYGVGIIKAIIGDSDRQLLNIHFNEAGKKLLDPSLSKLDVLD